MNWTRGLFRLWLVGSVLWVVFALLVTSTLGAAGDYLSGQFQRTDISGNELSVSLPAEGIVTVRFQEHAHEVDIRSGPPSEDQWSNILNELAIEMNKTAALENARLRRVRADIMVGLGLAALPPLFVLTLGVSLLWAARGFAGERKL